ncbi:hypothetical protein C1M51_02935 [Methylibium sp. Pch-M]|uniref:hypothetical protein n=1 Tax=Methylibium sp. Pch-M TaxID=2082386 RepID=UPI001010FDF8|nr:hypothetical protein [Methylibium sp. Pch-M]QAZ38460.1 hypothetical protein C1M51_02935 [Methylibium sp. Pch-M]
MFILDSLTKVRFLDVRVLSKKDRKPGENPGVQLLMQATLGVGVLAMFDGFLPGMLYRKPTGKAQGELAGIDTAELTAVGEHVKRLPWVYEQTGCTLTIDFGLGGGSNLVLDDVKVHRLSMRPEQTGVVIQWTADVPGLNDTTRGKLTGLKSTDVQMLLAGPEVDDSQAEIEEVKPAAKKARKGDADPSGSKEPWPFPKGGAAAKGDDPVLDAAKEAHGVA